MYVPYREKPHELRVSSLAMFVLLMFNDQIAQAQGLTKQQIMTALSIDEESCKKTLLSLANPKIKIITRQVEEGAKQQQAAIQQEGGDEEMKEAIQPEDSKMIDTT